jgi:hypothetical protein
MKKRILVALIACMLTMTILLPCASAESIFSPQASVLIDSSYVEPNPMGSGRIDVTASIEANYSVDQLGFSYIRLQEYRNGAWTTVKSVSSKYVYSSISHMYSFTYYGTAGMSYRAQAGYLAKDGSVTETRSSTSGTITCN